MSNADIPIDDLTVVQKLDLMERLWIDLSRNPSDVPSPEWHGDVLAKRLEAVENGDVEFIEGPTQKTLPQYNFSHKVQIALIDGAHGYPFPDMDYYYFYPIIETGGLLLVDDLQIPSIRRMFEIIKEEDILQKVYNLVNDQKR